MKAIKTHLKVIAQILSVFMLSLFIIIISCKKDYTSMLKKDRFSMKVDTTYEDNSTKIKEIERTFYHYEKLYDELKITEVLGEQKYKATIMNYDKSKYDKGIKLSDRNEGILYFKDNSELEWFINTMDTVLVHYDKYLKYWIKREFKDQGSISRVNYNYPEASVWFKGTGSGVSITLSKSEVDSLSACYKRYREEINDLIRVQHSNP